MGILKKAHDYLENAAKKNGVEERPKDFPIPGGGPKSSPGSDPVRVYYKVDTKNRRRKVVDTTTVKTHNVKRNKTN